ncbi:MULTISPECIES: hypothetical protein [Acinetobacter]|uniref:Uncharacterized protein n=1 Tax=Acinetobacter nematophilus TaxID=2994642 RepID=A0A9X3IIU5_9GAMM|nr:MULTISPECIES: hypothetical protein [Acinetobacter]MCX5469581.1 hypothetical protein [Acinetobacter nematophilus]
MLESLQLLATRIFKGMFIRATTHKTVALAQGGDELRKDSRCILK